MCLEKIWLAKISKREEISLREKTVWPKTRNQIFWKVFASPKGSDIATSPFVISLFQNTSVHYEIGKWYTSKSFVTYSKKIYAINGFHVFLCYHDAKIYQEALDFPSRIFQVKVIGRLSYGSQYVYRGVHLPVLTVNKMKIVKEEIERQDYVLKPNKSNA